MFKQTYLFWILTSIIVVEYFILRYVSIFKLIFSPDTNKIRENTSLKFQHSFSQRPEMSLNWKMSEKHQMFILGASGVNISTTWDTFHIYGQWYYTDMDIENSFMKCCFKFDKMETIEQTNVSRYETFKWAAKLKVWHVTCPNPKQGRQPEWVSIVTKHTGFICESIHVSYVIPYFPLKQQYGSLVISAKSAYNNLNAEMVISWMETYIYLGVDKIVGYKHEGLNTATAKVLDYYSSTGILDLFVYELADDINFSRNMSHHHFQKWSDEEIVILDYYERYSGFTFSGIIDYDEFLIPAANRTIKEMLSYLFSNYTNASAFRFKSQYFVSAGTKQITSEFLKTYITREASGPKWDRPKLLSKTADKLPGPVTEHKINSGKGLQTHDCPENVGYIRHFRKCVLKTSSETCKPNAALVRDLSMATWSRHIEQNVKYVLRTVLNKY